MADLRVKIKDLEFANPVTTASGTFGFGYEFEDFFDLDKLGGFFMKGTTLKPRQGNPYPRMAETQSGMLNAVGLQNKGVDYFVENLYPGLRKYKSHMIVNVNGSTIEEYVAVTEKINELDDIPAIELNISCPNVKEGGMAFGTSCVAVENVVKAVRQAYDKVLIVKLSPNVTDITEIARVCEANGADAVSLVNTFLGMAIDAEKQAPKLSTITGGLSGPCIKPIALRMVWQVFNAVKVPVVGMGGIMNATDAIEFMLAGSSVVQVGTGNFVDPLVTLKIIDGINEYLDRHNINKVSDIIGALKV